MAAMAAQQAPKMENARSAKAPAPKGKEKPKGMKDKLHDLPQAAGVVIMVVLLAAALVIGNFRALQGATPKDFIRQGDVKSIVEDRIDAAENVLSVAGRANLDENAIHAVETAIEQLEEAKTARDISRADQDLSAAVSLLTTADGLAQDAAYMQRAADDFAEQGNFLRQEARAYNKEAEKAEKLYESLPTKFLFAEPDMYEGI